LYSDEKINDFDKEDRYVGRFYLAFSITTIIAGASMSVERMERLQQQAEERREAKEERRRKNREEWAALNRTTGHASKWWTPSN
jgi:hypothetical protein